MDNEILTQWNPWWEEKNYETSFIEREIMKDIEKWMDRKEIISFVGSRRSGKTSLIYLLIEKLVKDGFNKNILFVKCDDDRIEKTKLIEDTLNTYRELVNPSGKIYVFLDEIQDIKGWEKTLKRIYDLEKEIKIIISGSNSSMLKEDLGEKLAGRIVYFEIYPFSFKEFISVKFKVKDKISVSSNKHKIKHYLNQYIEFGGFPEIALEKDNKTKIELLKFYFDTIVFRDVLRRRNIRSTASMDRLINFYLQNVSNPVSFSKIGKLLNLSADTVGEYTKYLVDAFFVFTVPIFSHSVKKQEIAPKKIYCVDNGLRNARGFRFSKDYGRLIENIVFVQLKNKYFSNPLVDIFYWKDTKEREVDFLVKENLKPREIIQVCWDVNDQKTKDRETASLIHAITHFKLKEGWIITEDYEYTERVGNKTINYVPLWKWLLN